MRKTYSFGSKGKDYWK